MTGASPDRPAPHALDSAAGALAALAILIGAASWFHAHVDGADLWWHLASGREAWEQGAIPLADPFSHTARGQPWTNHSWLWGWIFWPVYDAHPDLAAWLNFALLVALFALVAWNALRRSGSWLAAGAATWLAAATSHWFLDVRPHVATLLLTALLLATLEWRRAPWLWPPLLALWVNLHAGFVFGLGLLGLDVGIRSAVALRRNLPLPSARWLGLLGAALAAVANPWGFSIYRIPFEPLDLGTPFRTLIEWRGLAPSLDPGTYAGRFVCTAVLALIGATRCRKPFPIALALATGAMAVQARRFVPLFAVCSAPLVAQAVAATLDLARRAVPRPAPGWLRLAASGAALGAALLLWHGVRFLPRPLQRWTALESFPTGAVAYLAAMPNPPRRLFHRYDWGGYLALHAPGVPVFIDGRAGTVYDDAVARAYLTLSAARRGWRRELAARRIDAVLVEFGSPLASALQSEDPPWRVAHLDPRSVLLFPPRARGGTALPAIGALIGGSELALSRGFYWRMEGQLERAEAQLLEARRLDTMNLFVYQELMLLAAARHDEAGVRRWTDEALRVYPRRANQVWAFAESAWARMSHCDAQLDALRRIRLDEPFVPDALRAEVRARIRRVQANLASGSTSGCAGASSRDDPDSGRGAGATPGSRGRAP